MSRSEARRRLQAADPNLKIVHGRRYPYIKRKDRIPKLLSDEEAEWLGLDPEEMLPVIPPQQNLDIQAKWSKKQMEGMSWTYGIDPRRLDKHAMVDMLLWVGALDEDGNLTGKQPRRRQEENDD